MSRSILIALLVFFTQSQASADWLSLCHGQAAAILQQKNANRLAHFWSPDESVTLLQLSQQVADSQCQQLEINANINDVLWAGFAPQVTKDTINIALQGVMRDERFLVSEVILPEPATAPVVKNNARKNTPKPITSTRLPQPHAGIRSTWFWSPALWLETPEKIFNTSSRFGIKRIYITVPTNNEGVKHRAELQKFIQLAHAQGLQVWAVLGDPHAVMSDGIAPFLAASAAYVQYNNSVPPADSLGGLQLDIEPYLIPGYSQNPAAWLLKYASVISKLHQAVPELPLDIVLPFWFDPDTSSVAAMLGEVAASVSQITIMDYRTDAVQIRRIASQFLNWGLRNKKAINIALETLPMEPEDRRHYRRAEAGELWQLNIGASSILLLLKDARPAMPGITSYAYTHKQLIDGTAISFFGKKDSLMDLLPPLEAELGAWSSFSGLAIHGLDHE